ncbi:MAG: 4Fe-4S binding protein [Sphingobacteriaceae bacterium]|nr:4Fe-4S binding protein [Cytophagaceae bacterium]
MTSLQKIGLALFIAGLGAFIGILGLGEYRLTNPMLKDNLKKEHYAVIAPKAGGLLDKTYTSKWAFIGDFKAIVDGLNEEYKGKQEWDKVIYDNYAFALTKAATLGTVKEKSWLLFWLSVGLGVLGALLYILPERRRLPGIKNDGIFYKNGNRNSATNRGLIGWIVGTGLILFYIGLYFYPEYLANWTFLFAPIGRIINGNESPSQWFVYGCLYTFAILVMGIRMLIKYRHSPYQRLRTASVMFFQTSFAFLIPELLAILNQPYQDLKNIWPLDYSFFFDYKINEKIQAGSFGVFMLGWGIFLTVVGVPLMTYFFGKRWYCSWVCGCGGLAETLGDPYRQLSDKSTKAWKIERYLIHGVLVFAVVMTAAVLYSYFSGNPKLFGFLDSYTLRSSYGFYIGAIFSGVVGTGFYPLMGNRVWCRFGCPLAAYLGLVQRYQSRFRITTNGGQCISCGNCSTYCEQGIDVRAYAQRGQDIVRSSCVGCGICSAVCPRGVLNLENADPKTRRMEVGNAPILVGNEGVKIRG